MSSPRVIARGLVLIGVGASLVWFAPIATAAVDTTPPYLRHAVRTKRAYVPNTGWNLWSVRLAGGDVGSGLDMVQFWFSTYGRPAKPPVGYKPGFVALFGAEIGVPGKYPPVWVRASDKAGNWSRWYHIR